MVPYSPGIARDLCRSHRKLTTKDFPEVILFFLDRPQFQIYRATGFGDQREPDLTVLGPNPQVTECVTAAEIESSSQAQQHRCFRNAIAIRIGQDFDGATAGRGTRLSQVAGDGSDDSALLRRVAEDFGVRNDVVSVAVATVAVHVV